MALYLRRIFAVFIGIFMAISSFLSGQIHFLNHDLTIELESNPSTGCTWVVEIDNKDVIKSSGSKYTDPYKAPGSVPVVGAAGTETFYFDAVSDGTATITFTYGRHWEGGSIFRTVVYKCESKDSSIKVLNVTDSAAAA